MCQRRYRDRVCRHLDALATLTRSDSLNAKQHAGSIPGDIAFLAMAHSKLGNKDQAQTMLARLREALKNPRWAKDQESRAFLQEAEEVIEGKAGNSKK